MTTTCIIIAAILAYLSIAIFIVRASCNILFFEDEPTTKLKSWLIGIFWPVSIPVVLTIILGIVVYYYFFFKI